MPSLDCEMLMRGATDTASSPATGTAGEEDEQPSAKRHTLYSDALRVILSFLFANEAAAAVSTCVAWRHVEQRSKSLSLTFGRVDDEDRENPPEACGIDQLAASPFARHIVRGTGLTLTAQDIAHLHALPHLTSLQCVLDSDSVDADGEEEDEEAPKPLPQARSSYAIAFPPQLLTLHIRVGECEEGVCRPGRALLDSLPSMPNLTSLTVSPISFIEDFRGDFNGASLALCKNLTYLSVWGINDSKTIPAIQTLTKLRSLRRMPPNEEYPVIALDLKQLLRPGHQLHALEELLLLDEPLDTRDFELLATLPSLTRLELDELDSTCYVHLAKLPRLRSLKFRYDGSNGDLPALAASLHRLTALRELDVTEVNEDDAEFWPLVDARILELLQYVTASSASDTGAEA